MARRRGRSCLAGLLSLAMVLALLGAGLWFGEGKARTEAEKQVSATLSQGLEGTVEVRIHDFLALWSAARGRLAHVSGKAPQVTLAQDGHRLTVKDFRFDARGIRDLYGSGDLPIEQLDASGTVTWAEFTKATGLKAKHAGQGRLQVVDTVEVLGRSMTIVVTGKPQVAADGRLTLSEPTATADGQQLPEAVVRQVLARVASQTDQVLPQGMKLKALNSDDAGVHLDLTGRDVRLERS